MILGKKGIAFYQSYNTCAFLSKCFDRSGGSVATTETGLWFFATGTTRLT